MTKKWSKETITSKLPAVTQNTKLIPNTTTKIAPFEIHFGRKPNKQSGHKAKQRKCTSADIKQFYLDKKSVKTLMLDQQAMWIFSNSEPKLDIQYNTPAISENDSETTPLACQIHVNRKHNSPIKITPDKFSIAFEDTLSVIKNKRKRAAQETLMRRAPEPRGSLGSLWNISPDRIITDYTPHSISLNTNIRENARIRKSDLAIPTETNNNPNTRTKTTLNAFRSLQNCDRV